MEDRTIRFFRNHQIQPACVRYVLREGGKTVLHLYEGRTASTAIPLKEVVAGLAGQEILCIQKGVAVSAAHITDISPLGVYTMSDGRTFQGRRRSLREHQENRRALHLDGLVPVSEVRQLTLLEKCTIYDGAPPAVCLIELLFMENGGIRDFVFRYANEKMLELRGTAREDLVGRTITELYKNLDAKPLIAYADVALNGTNRIFRARSLATGEELNIGCHQPEPGFCVCTLVRPADIIL